MFKSIEKTMWYVVGEFFVLIVLPLILDFVWPDFIKIRQLFLIGGLLYTIIIARRSNIRFNDMGLRKKNFKQALTALVIPTTLFSIAIIIGYLLIPDQLFIETLRDSFEASPAKLFFTLIFYYNVVSVPVQELIFRGFYIPRLKYVATRKLFIVIWTAFVFMSVHIIYGNILFDIGTFVLGIFYSINFLKFRNLYSIMVSHAIIGTILSLVMVLIVNQ